MKVAVVFGGASLEAEVSRASGEAALRALVAAGHEARLIALGAALPAELQTYAPDVVFPVAHGTLGEDGCLQGLLEILSLPYVGSGVLASATAANKQATKLVYRAQGLPVASDLVVQPETVPSLSEVRAAVGAEFIVKPVSGGSSFGVTRLSSSAAEADWRQAVQAATAHGPALVETLLHGVELTCGVLDVGAEAVALPPTQVEAQAGQFYDFLSKYAPGGSVHRCPAPLSAEATARVQELAVLAHRALGARDLSRTDMILAADGTLTLLETNTLPGMTGVSLFPEAALAADISFPHLVDQLVQAALRRAVTAPARAQGVALPEPFASVPPGH